MMTLEGGEGMRFLPISMAPVDIDNFTDGDLNRNIPHYKGKVNGRKIAFEQRGRNAV